MTEPESVTDPAENATERIREYMPQCSDKEIAHIIRTAYAPDMLRLDKLKAENDRYRERLLVSPQGDDKIDELEEANEILRNNCEVAKAKLESLLHEKGE
jgi:LPS O-antigen subunit length determinant protein (WzzB/FepE family)